MKTHNTPKSYHSAVKSIGFFAILSLILAASNVFAQPSTLEFFTSFDGSFGNELGTGDTVAVFDVGFSGVLGIGHLYHSGSFAWNVNAGQTGVITFDRPASVVAFWAGSSDGGAVIQVFDRDNNVIDQVEGLPTNISGNNADFFEFNANNLGATDGIARITLNNNTSSFASIDDFGFTPIDTNGGGEPNEPVVYIIDGARDLGGGWYFTWIGLINTTAWPWFFHNEMGWFYAGADGNANTSSWLFAADSQLATWLWTSNATERWFFGQPSGHALDWWLYADELSRGDPSLFFIFGSNGTTVISGNNP
ncbi:hypothetical protein [Rubellicoccus peritrichatus]|uniref:Uncharacterized protein n=1 Tax=Rubellicoccus peritrichatus TaxID=3080537 RepID=A0AAQ3L5W5_9BACT|nr:hypothetical protein [Puniceicoccus sp. CR14]WOO39641.1 hypothetical protein RZN69_13540 [Puniceicoccus sp. CR14]